MEREEAIPARPQAAVPNPDPTLRTMELVDKAIIVLKAELAIRLDAVVTRFDAMDQAIKLQHDDYVRVPTQVDKAVSSLRELVEARLEGMMQGEKDLRELLTQTLAKEVAEIKGSIESLTWQTTEKFIAVDAQFKERDTRTDQRAGDTKLAVDAAFAAAKENTAKIEIGLTKQLDSLVLQIQTGLGNLDGKIADLKDRLTSLESRTAVTDPATVNAMRIMAEKLSAIGDSSRSMQAQKEGSNATWAIVMAVIGLVVPIIGVIAFFVGKSVP